MNMNKGRFGRRSKYLVNSAYSAARNRRKRAERRQAARRRLAELAVVAERRGDHNRRRGERRDKCLKLLAIEAVKSRSGNPSDDIPVYVCEKKYSPTERLAELKDRVHNKVMEVIDLADFRAFSGESARDDVIRIITGVMEKDQTPVSGPEQGQLIEMLVHDLLGFGPLEPLLADESISDIMVNGHDKVWIERKGKLELTDVTFNSNKHLLNVITRIVSRVNRRVDESSPMVDARLPDGSRINVVIPPLSYHFPSISIRKFADSRITLDDMVNKGSLSEEMAAVLKIIAKFRLNILISGGTGVGKTTLLNALSHYISPRERIVTIEDTAELQLHQPNVVSLESRPPNLEDVGAVTIGDLLINALRMRPDRILVGEVRGAEAADMLQAMNTGHDGSIGTIHANSTRDALLRFENMICLSNRYRPGRVTRQQIMSALDIVVQMSRMSDGVRRVTCISEVVGIEDEVVITQDLYRFNLSSESADGRIKGQFATTRLRPRFFDKLKHFRLSAEEKRFVFPPAVVA
ncbi:MAG: CpaF family protein [Alphaproteobacteria bacterium]